MDEKTETSTLFKGPELENQMEYDMETGISRV